VSAQSKYEVAYAAKKMGVTQAAVKAAIKKVGSDRAKIGEITAARAPGQGNLARAKTAR